MRYVLLRTCLEQYVTRRSYDGHFLMTGKVSPVEAAPEIQPKRCESYAANYAGARAVTSFAGTIKRFYNFRDQLWSFRRSSTSTLHAN